MRSGGLAGMMEGQFGDYPAYRLSDVRFHVALAESTGSSRLIAAKTASRAR